MPEPLVVVLPVHAGDIQAALRNLVWCVELDLSPMPFECILSVETGFDASVLESAAALAFAKVSVHRYTRLGRQPWPKGPNAAFRAAALHMVNRRSPWLWWEPDAIPLKRGWLSEIASAYATCGYDFMGTHGATASPSQPPHMNGVGVYPADVIRRGLHSMFGLSMVPFDVAGGHRVLDGAYITSLFQHVWSWNQPYSAKSPACGFTSTHDLGRISPGAVLFHRCKDGSLINHLRSASRTRRSRQSTYELTSSSSDVTVVITNYQRPEHLRRAFDSCLAAGVRNIVISSSAPNQGVKQFHRDVGRRSPGTRITSVRQDAGCNETWLRGVLAAKTPWVHILHDDDELLPAFRDVDRLIKDQPAPFYHWTGSRHGEVIPGIYDNFPSFGPGVHHSDIMWPVLLGADHFSISPVGGLFPRAHLVEVLEECERALLGPEFHLSPTMMVGNDLMIWLRATEKFPRFYYSKRPLVSYGHWDGSASFDDVTRRRDRLRPIYNATRAYYATGPELPKTVRPLVHIRTAFGSGPAVEFAAARWCAEYQLGPWTSKVITDESLPKLFKIGNRAVPYLKDMIEAGMKDAPRDAIFVFTNSDIIPCEGLTRLLVDAFNNHEAAFSFRRDVCDLRTHSPYEIRTVAKTYSGLDLFAFTRDWWERHSRKLPDLLFATEVWDYCFRLLMEETGAKRFLYLIYHHMHTAEGIVNSGSEFHNYNHRMARPFLADRNGLIYWENANQETSSLCPR